MASRSTGATSARRGSPRGVLKQIASLTITRTLLVRPLLRYCNPIRLLIRVHVHRSAVAFLNRPGMPARARMRSPRFRTNDVSTCLWGLGLREVPPRQANFAGADVAFFSAERDRHLGIRPISQLNTQPVVSPVNASRRPSRDAAHHSGPGRLARPYRVEDLHLLSFASFPGARRLGSRPCATIGQARQHRPSVPSSAWASTDCGTVRPNALMCHLDRSCRRSELRATKTIIAAPTAQGSGAKSSTRGDRGPGLP
jgi:hypothetical protein